MRKKKTVSSRDVAREAGVSQATVSYVLNDVKNVKIKPETREAVMDAVRRLNYHPDQIARGMKLKSSMSVGVVTDRNITNFYFMKTLEGIRDGMQQHNYSITLLFNKFESIEDAEFIKYYDSNRLDGIIFAFASLEETAIQYMNDRSIPFVIVDAQSTQGEIHEVCSDYLSRVTEVVHHFLKSGASRIGYAGVQGKGYWDLRQDALRRALEEKGLSLRSEDIAYSIFDDAQIFKVVTELLSRPDRPDALLAGSPRFGLLAVKCAALLGLKVPGEFRIVALGSSNFHTVAHPSLSAVELPLYDMGYRAAQMLFDLMNGEETEKTVVLPSELVIRESS
jgi:DNA-binding LacI/PurR family transcriptional regulator